MIKDPVEKIRKDRSLRTFYEHAQISYSPLKAARERLQNLGKRWKQAALVLALVGAGGTLIQKGVHNFQYNSWAEPYDKVHEMADATIRHVSYSSKAPVRSEITGSYVSPALQIGIKPESLESLASHLRYVAKEHPSEPVKNASIRFDAFLDTDAAYISSGETVSALEEVANAMPQEGWSAAWFFGLGGFLSLIGLGGGLLEGSRVWKSSHREEYQWRKDELPKLLYDLRNHEYRDTILSKANEYLQGSNWRDADWIINLADQMVVGEHTARKVSQAPSSEILGVYHFGRRDFRTNLNKERERDGARPLSVSGF